MSRMRGRVSSICGSQQFGLLVVIALLCIALTFFAGSHPDRETGRQVNNFLNSATLIQIATETSFFAVMAVGATLVIITGGIDLSVGAIYALTGVGVAMLLRAWHLTDPQHGMEAVLVGLGLTVLIGVVCGFLNGFMIVKLNVHPFVITIGTMWMFRGLAFVTSKAESILVPDSLTAVAKAPLGLAKGLYPVPLLLMIVVTIFGVIYLTKTVAGRYVFAVGGNVAASKYSGVNVSKVLIGVYTLCGLMAGLSALLGCSYYGSASCGDGTGYELYVIASAVVGGVSLTGGKGSALGATLGALLIVLIRQSISFLHLDQNYQWIIIGAAIIVAVVLDRYSSSLSAKRATSMRSTG